MNGRNGIFLVALEYINAQTHSPLFKLPRELRDKIYKLAFTSPEQTEQLKDGRPHFHPPYLSQRTANPSLLQSCKRAYTEAWSIWWITTQHTLWLSASTTSIDATPPTWLADMLGLLKQHHYRYELDNVRFVGQTAESSEQPHQLPLSKFLALPDFHPVTITIVVRHVDWPGWQCCEHLRISGMLPRLYSFPSSVRQITLELETLESKVDQLAEIVQAMKLQWCFSTVDCAKLTAVRAPIVMQIWHGSSTWAGKRWARDESEPEVVHYSESYHHFLTIVLIWSSCCTGQVRA